MEAASVEGCNSVDRVSGTIFARGASLFLLKYPVETGKAGKPGLQGDFCDGQIWLGQEFFSYFYPSENQIFMISKVRVLFKKP